jgi:signal transduction histidine kinase
VGIVRRAKFPGLILLCILATASIMGSVLSSLFTRAVTEWEWQNTAALTRRQVELVRLDELFTAAPDARPPERWAAEIALLFGGLPEIVRVKVWDGQAGVLWSDEPRLIGQRFPNNAPLKSALAGTVAVEVKELRGAEHRYEAGRTLAEVYVPISSRQSGEVVGVLEVYKTPNQLQATIGQGQTIIWAISLAGGLILGLTLLPLFRQISRQELAQARRLEQEAYARRLEEEVAERTQALERTQTQLVQAQKMEAVGQLAGGIAHDFNNLLTVITGRSEILLEDLSGQDAARTQVELIKRTAERAAALTQQLLAFSRKQILQPVAVDLNVAVTRIEPMLRRLIGEHVAVSAALEPALGTVSADPTQLDQIIVNLAVNARDAMPGGGQITLSTANVELGEADARRHPGLRPGRYVMLAVADTGAGMDAATQAHIFEPFFTTKEPGKGTGLGLSMVYGIVQQSGGHIRLDSEPGRGATFRIYLPRVEAPVWAPGPSPAPARPERGSETILLVEDETDLRDLAREILEGQGYTVLIAGDPQEALRLAGGFAGSIHLLLTDVVMPQMSGRELATRLAPGRPDMKVLYMSGYTDDVIVGHGVLDPRLAFLSKPFTPGTLAGKVREVLEAPQGVGRGPR